MDFRGIMYIAITLKRILGSRLNVATKFNVIVSIIPHVHYNIKNRIELNPQN